MTRIPRFAIRSATASAALALAAISAPAPAQQGAPYTVVETGKGYERLQDAVNAIGGGTGTFGNAVLNRIRGPFNLSGPAIAAGAAAIADEAFVQSSAEHNSRWLEWLTRELEALGRKVTPSVGNFLLVHFPSDAGKTAADADAALVASGIYLRRLESYGFPGALRLSVGTEEANRAVVDTLTVFLGKA